MAEKLNNFESKKNQRWDPYKMSNIKFVQSGSNFAQFSNIKEQKNIQNLKSLTQKKPKKWSN